MADLVGPDFVFEAPVADLTDTEAAVRAERAAEQRPNRRGASRTLETPEIDLYGGYDWLLVRTALVRAKGYSESAKAPIVDSPEAVAMLCRHLAYADQEHVVVIGLNARNEVLAIHEAFIGGTSQSMVELTHAMKVALLTSARALILVHNHPSGVPVPSREDHELTRKITESAQCVGLVFFDHVIVARQGYYSFEQRQPTSWKGRVLVGL